MTTELGNSDASRAAERRALSRRQMIKASAVAGAAAWTAPMIVDSISSPALGATASGCKQYFAKYGVRGASPFNCPGSGTGFDVTQANGTPSESSVSFPVTGATWGGAGSGAPSGCGLLSGNSNKISSVTLDGGYRKVTLVSGCRFTTDTDWQCGGRYGDDDPGDRYIKVSDRTTTSGYGYFTNGGTTAWVYDAYPTDSNRKLQYFYLKWCCDS